VRRSFAGLVARIAVAGLLAAACESSPTPAKEGAKCFYGDRARGPCAEGFFCKPRRTADGQIEMEKVGVDKTIAVGDCRAPVAAGKPCDRDDQCAGGKSCTHPTPTPGASGTCEGG
jgi:hypothetical protein